MKRFIIIACIIVLVVIPLPALAGKGGKNAECTTIQSGELFASDGNLIETGFDDWGYNYQAHEFKGYYCDSYRDAEWCQAWKDVKLKMKWNDAWISNKDCDGNYLLDRHYGLDSYIGSGAWLTNHQSGTDIDENGDECDWNYFVKIVAAPADAYKESGIWYTDIDKSKIIGPVIWGAFATILEIENDCTDKHGVSYQSPAGPGFGKFK